MRLGLRMVRGFSNADAARLIAARDETPYESLDDVWRRGGFAPATLARLAEADAFRPAFGLARRAALWAVKGLRDAPLPLFAALGAGAPEVAEPAVALRPMPEGGEVVRDYRHTGLSLRPHPASFLREDLDSRGFLPCAHATAALDGSLLGAAGLVLMRQRPGSAKGVLFITIEDETGLANLVVWTKVFAAHRRTVLCARMLGVVGRVQKEGAVVHLVAQGLEDLSELLDGVGARSFPSAGGRGDETRSASPPEPRAVHIGERDVITVKTRDFR